MYRGVPVDVLEELLLYESPGGLCENDALEALENGNSELAVAIVSRLQLPSASTETPTNLPTIVSPLIGRLLGIAVPNGARQTSIDYSTNGSSVSDTLRLSDLLETPLGPHGASAFQLLMAGGRACLVAICDLLYGPRSKAAEKVIREAMAQRDARGRLPAHYAAAARNSASLEWLISRGANVTEVDYDGTFTAV